MVNKFQINFILFCIKMNCLSDSIIPIIITEIAQNKLKTSSSNSADGKLVFFFPENRTGHFMQIVRRQFA